MAVIVGHKPISALDREQLSGVKKYMRRHRLQWRIALFQPSAPTTQVLSWRPDGVISCVAMDSAVFEVPVVHLGYRQLPDEAGMIYTDQKQIGTIAADHLFDRRFRSFAFLGCADKAWSALRQDAYVEALKQHNFACGQFDLSIRNEDVMPIKRRPTLAEWLAGLPDRTALFAVNDYLALEVLSICREIGRDVPKSLAVLGVDDVDFECELTDPPLSSVVNPMKSVGYEGGRMMAELLTGTFARSKRLSVRSEGVHVRKSTDVTAVDDLIVDEAIRYIRANLESCAGVEHVAKAIRVARSTLHRHFVQALGHSPLQELQRLRVQRAEELLLTTDLSMVNVAERCGFSDDMHLTRVFRAAHGVTPGTYRRQTLVEDGQASKP